MIKRRPPTPNDNDPSPLKTLEKVFTLWDSVLCTQPKKKNGHNQCSSQGTENDFQNFNLAFCLFASEHNQCSSQKAENDFQKCCLTFNPYASGV